jgi:hypothetical protein
MGFTSISRAADAPKAKESGKSGSWVALFDGTSTRGWRGFGKPSFPAQGWTVKDGWLTHVAKGGGGDIITDRLFTDFELRFEWRISAGGNSGVKYFIDEARKAAIGHEYQIIDDAAHPDAQVGPKRQTAALYDALPAGSPKVKPAGQINESAIVVKGLRAEIPHRLAGIGRGQGRQQVQERGQVGNTLPDPHPAPGPQRRGRVPQHPHPPTELGSREASNRRVVDPLAPPPNLE